MARSPPAGDRLVPKSSKKQVPKLSQLAKSESSKQGEADQDRRAKKKPKHGARRDSGSQTPSSIHDRLDHLGDYREYAPVRESGPPITPEEAAYARPSIEWVDQYGHSHPRSSYTVKRSNTEEAESREDVDEEGDDQEQGESAEEDGEAGFADGLGDSPKESSDEDPADLDFEPGKSRKRKKTTRKLGKSRR